MESTTNTAKQHCVTLALEVPPTINSPQNKDAKSPEAARFIQSSQQKPPAFIPKIPRSRIRGNPENRIPDACHPQAEAGSGPEKNPQGKQHKKQLLELCGLGQVSDPLTPPFPRVQQSCCEEIAGRRRAQAMQTLLLQPEVKENSIEAMCYCKTLLTSWSIWSERARTFWERTWAEVMMCKLAVIQRAGGPRSSYSTSSPVGLKGRTLRWGHAPSGTSGEVGILSSVM